jgi:two-component system chemotaxis sensor kinase CheA
MSIEDTELLAEFVIESQEHLENVESQLLSLEAHQDEVDTALVNNVFRAVHSIKGAAGFLGLTTLEALAHREEEVLNRLRNLEIRPTSAVVTTLLAATDRLKGLLAAIDTSNDQDVSDHIAALEQLLAGCDRADDSASLADQASAGAREGEVRPAPTSTASCDAIREFIIESCDILEQIDRDLVSLERDPSSAELINVVFRNIHTIKGSAGFLAFSNLERLAHAAENLLGKLRSGETKLCAATSNLLFSTVDALRKHMQHIETSGTDGSGIADGLIAELHAANEGSAPAAPRQTNRAPTARAGKSSSAATEKPAIEKPATEKPAAKSSATSEVQVTSAADTTIRVDVALLDKLMTRVGELVLARNQIIQFGGHIRDSELLSASQRLNLITTELQEGVMKTRMQPIGNVWSKFPRIVRDLASACGKEVRIEMEGKETELDKTIIEAIKDPLTHLVRNSVDHGIETPETRVRNSKPMEGCLLLRAYHEGGQVNIEISDDGAGLSLEKIKAKALEEGLISQDQAEIMPDHDAAQLIFLPGFSTADRVSNVSGRGVGMDVVKTNIEKIGGMIDIQSRLGQGTAIKIKIPLTLAIIPALIITNDGNRFAIPQVNLLELVRLESDQAKVSIEWIQGAPVYRLRGRLLPLVYMHKVLQTGDKRREPADAVNIVVLRADERQFGLVVDQINDTEEIVVKPLAKQLKSIPVFSGATIMGDGKVALILDVIGLAHASNVVSKERAQKLIENNAQGHHSSGEKETLLILGTNRKQRLALPISQVARLEKIDKRLVECAGNQEVVQYRNEILPLIRLARVLGMDSQEDSDDPHLNVVVYHENSRSVGLVVERIIDIVETTLEVSHNAQRVGLRASAVIQERVTDVVDLPAVIRQVGVFSVDAEERASTGGQANA